ncbi:methylamine utilization protein [Altererythrobacter salegens]|uniref:Methylamine utilization protein n=1 Tax=Croceibacterium salegens TaxID=1737568 RepID=A0A6I4SUD7_9SPHN|nr:methylamine utilization protein [Croceibacterium salegens]MXO59714.1 methylamine utilization protein [Croceibacterium salegens]
MIARIIARFAAALSALALAGAAQAADITVTVTDDSGRPVPDAVVIADVPGAKVPPKGVFRIDQKDTAFVPFMLVVPVGSRVEFANLDPFRHHVYSFSPGNKFELKLFGKGEVRSAVLGTVGTVAIGCNIHDTMQAFVRVVDTPYALRTDDRGRAVLKGVPASARTLRVWHPRLRAPGNELKLAINPAGNLSLPVKVKLRRPAPMSHDY